MIGKNNHILSVSHLIKIFHPLLQKLLDIYRQTRRRINNSFTQKKLAGVILLVLPYVGFSEPFHEIDPRSTPLGPIKSASYF